MPTERSDPSYLWILQQQPILGHELQSLLGQVFHNVNRLDQGRLTVNYRYTHRKFQLKFSALLKDYVLKYAENSKKKSYLTMLPILIYRSICRNSYF